MFDTPTLIAFSLASLALLIVPGPAVLFIIGRSLELGRSAGLVCTLGVASASALHAVFAALGLSVLVQQSALAFAFVKYIGAAYLVYLAYRAWTDPTPIEDTANTRECSNRHIFFSGLMVNLFNPKTALFFLAFLPQFVDPAQGAIPLQILVLGGLFTGLAIVSDSVYVILAGSAYPYLHRTPAVFRWQKRLCGGVYLLLALLTVFADQRKRA